MIVSLLDRGVVYAIAHIRGGGDLGKPWHDAGRMATKMNTFTDFIDSAEGLLKTGWAKRGAIAIEGRSAGGLLMGAVTNMRPDLWRVVIAGVPFVDVLNTMHDESLPLTTAEFEEWGNPKIPEQFGWHVGLQPVRQRREEGLPGDARRELVQRQPGHVLGAGEVGREAPREQDGQEPALPAHEHETRRAWRAVGAVRPYSGAGVRLRVRARSAGGRGYPPPRPRAGGVWSNGGGGVR